MNSRPCRLNKVFNSNFPRGSTCFSQHTPDKSRWAQRPKRCNTNKNEGSSPRVNSVNTDNLSMIPRDSGRNANLGNIFMYLRFMQSLELKVFLLLDGLLVFFPKLWIKLYDRFGFLTKINKSL